MTKSSDTEVPFLDYYRQHQIIPVAQSDRGSTAHLSRRSALYRQLGVGRSSIENRKVIEFGPGTGDNAVHIVSLRPSRLVLVDGNPYSIAALRAKKASGVLPEFCEIVESTILDFETTERFDVAICEGTMPGQKSPERFLKHVASFTGDHGTVITTAIGALSYLAEICRKALVPILTEGIDAHETKVARCVQFFAPHLTSLRGMTRSHEDWVLDNLLHPWTKFGLFNGDDAINALADEFHLVGSSPDFLQDWRWYKEISSSTKRNAEFAVGQYQKWAPYLLDYRVDPGTSLKEITLALTKEAEKCMLLEAALPAVPTAESYREFADVLQRIAALLWPHLPGTAKSIDDYLHGLTALLTLREMPDFGEFVTWLGRGTQYLSFERA